MRKAETKHRQAERDSQPKQRTRRKIINQNLQGLGHQLLRQGGWRLRVLRPEDSRDQARNPEGKDVAI